MQYWLNSVHQLNAGPTIWLSSDFSFSRSNFQIAVSQEWMVWLIWNKKGSESIGCWADCVTSTFEHTHDLELEFSRWHFEITYLRTGGAVLDLQNPYLCNYVMDFLRLKFCGIVWHLPHMSLPIDQKLFKFGTNWVQTLSTCVDLSRLVVVQGHSYLPIWPIWATHGPKTCQIRQHLGQTCGTHICETAGWIHTIWSSMEFSRHVVVQHHGHLTLTLDFQCQYLKCSISGMGGPIDMKRKGCESIGC